jgi:DNA-binding MarR family transcriptional regulator
MIDTQATDAVPAADARPGAQAPFLIEESLGYLMRRIVTLVGGEIERRMEPLGLTEAQWKPLLRLYLDQGNTVATLARGCALDAGGMTRLLDRLEAKGLCRRSRSVEDRRVVNLELTPEGVAAAEQIPAILERVHEVAADGFDADEHRLLRGFLGRILDNVLPFGGDADGACSPPAAPAPRD